MNTREISNILFKDKITRNVFCGVFAADQVPVLDKPYGGYVVNTDEAGLPGQHWIALYVDNYKLEYFDSYGLAPLPKFNYFLEGRDFVYNAEQLQSVLTASCGHYVIYYLLKRCKNMDMLSIVNRFTDDYLQNDLFVTDTINDRYNLSRSVTSNVVKCSRQSCRPYQRK